MLIDIEMATTACESSKASSVDSDMEEIKRHSTHGTDKDLTSQNKTRSIRVCRTCLVNYDTENNFATSCRYHPESFCGETAQRWMAPGDTKGGGEIHNFYSCCGATSLDSPGCCSTYHKSFDEEENEWGRKPT